jgi:hypothetical protein
MESDSKPEGCAKGQEKERPDYRNERSCHDDHQSLQLYREQAYCIRQIIGFENGDDIMVKIDVAKLMKDARKSPYRESSLPVIKGSNFKIYVSARFSSKKNCRFLIETCIYIHPQDHDVDIEMMVKGIKVMKEIKAKGYTIKHYDNGSICCEIKAERNEIERLCEEIISIIEGVFERHDADDKT